MGTPKFQLMKLVSVISLKAMNKYIPCTSDNIAGIPETSTTTQTVKNNKTTENQVYILWNWNALNSTWQISQTEKCLFWGNIESSKISYIISQINERRNQK